LKLCWFVVEVSREASSVFFILSKSGLDVFYHWYFSGNSSVHVSQNIEISSYFGLSFSWLVLLTNILLTFSQNTSFTFCSSINAQKIFPKLLFCDFLRNSGRFSKGPKGMKKMASSPLGAGEKHFLIREFIFICPSWSSQHFCFSKQWKSLEFNCPKLGS